MPYDELGAMQHRLELDGRERLLVSGVEEVERFDEEEIVMNTKYEYHRWHPGSRRIRPAYREIEPGRR